MLCIPPFIAAQVTCPVGIPCTATITIVAEHLTNITFATPEPLEPDLAPRFYNTHLSICRLGGRSSLLCIQMAAAFCIHSDLSICVSYD